MKKIICINILIFAILFCLLEFVSYLYLRHDSYEYMEKYNKIAKENNLQILSMRYAPVVYNNADADYYRQPQIGSKNKPSILFFGCSYIYGSMVEEKYTIPYLITKRTGRTTINRGLPGGSILNMFNDLSSDDFYKDLKNYPEPDYIIYLWINDHLNRICNPYITPLTYTDVNQYSINPIYEQKDGKLIKKFPPKWKLPFYALYTVKAYFYFYSDSFAKNKKDKKMLSYFIIAKNICKEEFPNAKFIVIEYKDTSALLMSDELRSGLKENGITLLNAENLAGHELDSEKWRASDKEHPSPEAFNDITSGLIKSLKL